ncbi:MAG TPA: YncE family protein [Chthoniobacterales bacterium]|nr:YncE family protein [Chthoniobacterales bacterium]
MKNRNTTPLFPSQLFVVASIVVVIVGGISLPAYGQTQGEASAIDSKPPKNQLIKTIPVGSQPFSLVVSPKGDFVYVAMTYSQTISVIATSTNTVSTTYATAPYYAGPLVITPDGNNLYAVSAPYQDGLGTATTAYELSVSTGSVVQTFTVGLNPDGIAISPNGKQIWVTNFEKDSTGTISIIDTANQTVLPFTVDIEGDPNLIAFTPNGKHVYAGMNASGDLSLIATSPYKILKSTIGHFPSALAIAPNGKKLYTIGENGPISVINTTDNKLVKEIAIHGPQAFGTNLALTSNNKYLYVPFLGAGFTPQLDMIDTATNKIVAGPILLNTSSEEAGFYGAAITPDAKYLYISDNIAGVVYVVDISPE